MRANKYTYTSPSAEDQKGNDAKEGEFSSSPVKRGRQLSSANAAEADEISLKDLILKIREWWNYLLSKWLVIVLAAIIGGLTGLAYAFINKPVYIAATTFVLESGDASGGLGQYAGIASMVGIDLGGGGGDIFQGDNIIELYKSRSMIEKTLLSEVVYKGEKQSLINRYIEFNKLREKWVDKPELKDIQYTALSRGFTRMQDSILGETVKDINKSYLTVGKPDKKLSIIKVEVKSKDEVFSKIFNEQIVKNVNDFYVQTKTKKASGNVLILQQKTDSVRAVLNNAVYSKVITMDATANLNPTRQILRIPAQKSEITAQANQIIYSELVKNLELAKINQQRASPLIQIIDNPIFPLEKSEPEIIFSLFLGIVSSVFLILVGLTLRFIIRNSIFS